MSIYQWAMTEVDTENRRRVVQITATGAGSGFYALCNDGSIWKWLHTDNKGWHWFEVKEIPQEGGV